MMNREEAIEKIDRYFEWVNDESPIHVPQEVLNALHKLKQPQTLATFLGWEEKQEYKWRGTKFRIFYDTLQYFDEDECVWWDSIEELNDYSRLSQAKKVEPKPKAWRVKDEYSFKCLMEELKGLKSKDIKYAWFLSQRGDIVIYDDKNEYSHSNYDYFSNKEKDNYELIDYHKEETLKFYAKIKGWELAVYGDEIFWNYNMRGNALFLGDKVEGRNIKTMFTKTVWNELGIDDSNADFEEIKEEQHD